MRENRSAVMDFVYIDEGGFAVRAIEPGGAVNMGISFERFEAWRALKGQHGLTHDDLKNMTRPEATEIYARFFFIPAHFDDLPSGVDYAVLDPWINGGGLVILNRALGFKDDHKPFDPVTLWAAKHRDAGALIDKLCDVRLARYRTLKNRNQPVKEGSKTTFLMVWEKRTELVRKRAKKLVT